MNYRQGLVFTNGCFDVLHPGHVALLRFARSLGTSLVVAVDSDRSVAALKGVGRPVFPIADRLDVVSSLRSVTRAFEFDGVDLADVLQQLRPEILVKGASYRPEEVAGREIVEAYGGRIVLAPMLHNYSSRRVLSHAPHTA